MILLGFATLMFGMHTMSGAVEGLKAVPAFARLFVMFKNPILGVIAGAILTAIIQSSSASVGILRALTVTGQVSYGAAIPIIMGQNIGMCICLVAYYIAQKFFTVALFDETANPAGVAVAHSAFNIIYTTILFPMAGLLEKLAIKLIPDAKNAEKKVEIDERLLAAPPIELEQCHSLAIEMFDCAANALRGGIASFTDYSADLARVNPCVPRKRRYIQRKVHIIQYEVQHRLRSMIIFCFCGIFSFRKVKIFEKI